MREINLSKVFYFYTKSLPYLRVTFLYVAVSLVLGFLLGAVVAKGKMSRHRVISLLAEFYVTIVRCTPSVILLFLAFYGLPAMVGGSAQKWVNGLPVIVFVILTFTAFIGASSSEIIRGAYESVNRGQREAGLSAGLTEGQTLLYIILPQMLKNSIANIGNTVIFLIKEGALAYTIGLRDVMGEAYFLSGRDLNAYALSMYVALTLIYWPLTILLEKTFQWMEKRMVYSHEVRWKNEH